MRLEYRILCFDDQKSNVEFAIQRIHGIISRMGFEPNIDLRIVSAEMHDPLVGIPDEDEVDLVMMDWRLGGEHDGAKLTRRLRQMYQNTDVVFYSSESPQRLRKLIFDEDIDGVFCCNRDRLSDRVGTIVHGQLRRILDLDHMRGIVMAATSDLDQGMIECLELIQKISYSHNPEAMSSAVSDAIIKGLDSKIDQIKEFDRKKSLHKLIREPSFGSSQRLDFLISEIEKVSDRITGRHIMDQLSVYRGEILTPRNDFAHRKAEKKNGKMVLAGRDKNYDQDTMRELRLGILRHSDNLRELIASLIDIASASGEQGLADQLTEVQLVVAAAKKSATAESLRRDVPDAADNASGENPQ